MARKTLIRSPIHPYHVTNRVNSKRPYPPEYLPNIWDCYCETLCILTWVYGVRVHAFVLMGNHYHLIISTPDANLDQAMQYFHREVSRFLTEMTRSQDFRFQARYKWKLIETGLQFSNTFSYVARNPLAAGVAHNPFLYRFSTFSGQFGRCKLICPIYECEIFAGAIPEKISDREEWLALGTGKVSVTSNGYV
jgi:putative transposase